MPTGRLDVSQVGLPDELETLLAATEVKRSFAKVEESEEHWSEGYAETFRFAFSEEVHLMMVIQMWEATIQLERYDFTVVRYEGHGSTQKTLLQVGGNDSPLDSFYKESALRSVMAQLGVAETSPVQFLAGMLAQAMSTAQINSFDIVDDSYATRGMDILPITKDAFTFLQEKIAERRRNSAT